MVHTRDLNYAQTYFYVSPDGVITPCRIVAGEDGKALVGNIASGLILIEPERTFASMTEARMFLIDGGKHD